MPRGLAVRLSRLEAKAGAGWAAWAGKPMDLWPDSALCAFLGASLGVHPAEVAAMSDADLQRIACDGGCP